MTGTPNKTDYVPPYKDTCQDCGKSCDVGETVDAGGGRWDYWVYCKDCDIETFHPCKGYKDENDLGL